MRLRRPAPGRAALAAPCFAAAKRAALGEAVVADPDPLGLYLARHDARGLRTDNGSQSLQQFRQRECEWPVQQLAALPAIKQGGRRLANPGTRVCDVTLQSRGERGGTRIEVDEG